jgi:hypothetical protein
MGPRIDLGKTGPHRAHESVNRPPEGAPLGAAAAVLQGIAIAGRSAATPRRPERPRIGRLEFTHAPHP